MDLFQEGVFGLRLGIKKFNPDLGYQLSTYVSWWIRQAMTRLVADQGRTIRIPVHTTEAISKLKRVQQLLTQKYGRDPTHQEIANELGIPVTKVVQRLIAASYPVSLDAPVNADDTDSATLRDYIHDSDAISADMLTLTKEEVELVEKILPKMNSRDREVLQARFFQDKTLEEIGESMGLVRERIRQIAILALKRFKVLAEIFLAEPPHPTAAALVMEIGRSFTARTWLEVPLSDRADIRILDRGICWISQTLQLQGNPLYDDNAYLRIAENVFGAKETLKILDGYDTAKKQVMLGGGIFHKEMSLAETASQMGIDMNDHDFIKTIIKEMSALDQDFFTKRFGLQVAPLTLTQIAIDRALAFRTIEQYARSAVMRFKAFAEVITAAAPHPSEQACREAIQRKYTSELLLKLSVSEREQFEICGRKIIWVARLFGVEGNLFEDKKALQNLAIAVFGEEEIANILRAKTIARSKARKASHQIHSSQKVAA